MMDMDAKAKEWQERFERIWDPAGEGNYRQGSCGARLAPLFVHYIKPGQTINDYGSGTGRAAVVIHKQGNYRINMVDIAPNALEEEAKSLLGDDLTFHLAPLWKLPEGFPHANWGYCADVLMTVPPEKLDNILNEIHRTCDNLFLEVYDWPDVRLGIDLTTIKEGPGWWESQLRKFWPRVERLESPEHNRRYMFVCYTGTLDVEHHGSIMALHNVYKDQTAWIVGRGASLLNVTKEAFGLGPVIVLNEAIMNISRLRLSNDVYTLWRNGDVLPDLPKYGAAMILCDNPVLSDPPSSTQFPDYRLRYVFECRRDLDCDPPATFSMKAALEIAVRIFGCNRVVFVGFDSCTVGDVKTVLDDGFVQSEHRPGAYCEQGEIVKARVAELDLDVEWIAPQGPTGPIRLNLGCGEIMLDDYLNIDLHYTGADIRMDVRTLDYADNAVDEIFASHLLEHFGKYEILPLLKDWRRVLKSGGILNLIIPDLEWCMKSWLKTEDKEGFALATIFGLQSNDGEYHKTGFTKNGLKRILTEAGFKKISIKQEWDEPHHQQSFFVTSIKG